MESLVSLLAVALLIWAGVFAFLWSVDRRVRALERRLEERRHSPVAEDDDTARVKEKVIR